MNTISLRTISYNITLSAAQPISCLYCLQHNQSAVSIVCSTTNQLSLLSAAQPISCLYCLQHNQSAVSIVCSTTNQLSPFSALSGEKPMYSKKQRKRNQRKIPDVDRGERKGYGEGWEGMFLAADAVHRRSWPSFLSLCLLYTESITCVYPTGQTVL